MTSVQIKVVDEDAPTPAPDPQLAQLLDVELLGDGQRGPSRLGGVRNAVTRPFFALRAVPHIATYAGMVLTLVGGVLLVVAWGRVAGLTTVGLQMPYVISAGCTGLGLIAAGLTIVNLAAKSEDSAKRRAQLGELRDLLAELRRAVDDGAGR